jgi:hypothetical protein
MIFRQNAPSRYPVPQPQALPCAQRSTARAVSFFGPSPKPPWPPAGSAVWGRPAAGALALIRRSCDGFRMPASADLSTGTRAGVRKPPRNETAGSRAPGGSASAMGNWLAPLSEHGPEDVAPARRTPKLELGRMRRAAWLRCNRADLEPLRSDFAEPRRCQP